MAANDISWKRRPSEIRGYERAMYATLENGDYIRVDYNTGEKIARIYVEVVEDRGASYYAVINNGRITVEKNSNGRSTRVAERISERADELSTLPNKDVLKIINKNYGITATLKKTVDERKERLEVERKQIKKRYFKAEDNPYVDNDYSTQYKVKKINLIDFLDTLTGIIVSVAFFFIGQYDLVSAGAAAVIWGMLLGIFDIILREREPVFLKIFFFLLAGTGLYFYGYFYF